MQILLSGFAVSLVVTFLILRSARAHGHLSGDVDMSGPQKFHARPVPRIGGVGIMVGLLARADVRCAISHGEPMLLGLMLLACGVPAFLSGLAEDLTKTQSPRRRLFSTAVSAALAAWLLGALITRTDIPGLDWLVSLRDRRGARDGVRRRRRRQRGQHHRRLQRPGVDVRR